MSHLALKGQLDLDGSGWEKTLKQADQGVQKLAHDTVHHLKSALAGAFAFGALEITIDKTIEYGEAVYNSARRVGESTDALQQLDYALRLNGSSLEAAIGVIEKFNIAKDKAFAGGVEGEKFIEYFHRLGISMEALKPMRGGEFILAASDKFKTDVDPQSLVSAFRGIGGKGAGELIPALREDLRKAAEEAEHFTKVMDVGVISALKDVGDQSKKAMNWTKALGAGIVSSFLGLEVVLKSAWAGGLVHAENMFNLMIGRIGLLKNPLKAMSEQANKDAEAFKELRAHLTEKVEPIDKEDEGGQTKAEAKAEAKLDRLREQLHDAQARERAEGLSHEQKILELTRQRLELNRKIEEDGPDSEKGLENQIKLARINGEIRTAKAAQKREENKPGRYINLDSFNGIGNVLGHTAREIPAIQERLIEAHTRTTTALHRVATALENKNSHAGVGSPFQLP